MRLLWKKSGGSFRVYRGGSWLNDDGDVRASNRVRDEPGDRGGDLGFRCVGPSSDVASDVTLLTTKEGLKRYAQMALARFDEELKRQPGPPSPGCVGMLLAIAEEVSK